MIFLLKETTEMIHWWLTIIIILIMEALAAKTKHLRRSLCASECFSLFFDTFWRNQWIHESRQWSPPSDASQTPNCTCCSAVSCPPREPPGSGHVSEGSMWVHPALPWSTAGVPFPRHMSHHSSAIVTETKHQLVTDGCLCVPSGPITFTRMLISNWAEPKQRLLIASLSSKGLFSSEELRLWQEDRWWPAAVTDTCIRVRWLFKHPDVCGSEQELLHPTAHGETCRCNVSAAC